MPTKPRMQYCFNCGESLGEFINTYGDILTCDSAECARAARDEERGQRENAQYEAERDDYERYR